MKVQTVRFACDNIFCDTTLARPLRSGFPYEFGWVYLHVLNGKVKKDEIIKHEEKHFCRKSCMIRFITMTFDRG